MPPIRIRQAVADDDRLRRRIEALVALPVETLDPATLKQELAAIGQL